MAIKDIPGITTMPKSERAWTKFILDLSTVLDGIVGGSGGSGNYVTLDTFQTITATKDFIVNPTFNGNQLWSNSNAGTQLNSLPADANPDASTDYILSYDASTDSPKKIRLDRLPALPEDESLVFFLTV